jgi:hypothetical protein
MDLQKSWIRVWPLRPWALTAGRRAKPAGSWVLPEHAGEMLPLPLNPIQSSTSRVRNEVCLFGLISPLSFTSSSFGLINQGSGMFSVVDQIVNIYVCGPSDVCHSYSNLPWWHKTHRRYYGNRYTYLSSKKTLFIKTESKLVLAHWS